MSAPEELLRILEGYDVRDTQPVEVPPRVLAEARLLIEAQAKEIAELTAQEKETWTNAKVLLGENRDLRAQLAALKREREAAVRMRKEAENAKTAAEVELDELRADFDRYAEHIIKCGKRAEPNPEFGSWADEHATCACGLDAARQRWSKT